MDRTDITIRRFLSALPATGYDLGILSERGMYRLESASYSRIVRMLPYLKHRNANGAHIYIRPTGESSYTLLDDLTQSTVAVLTADGFAPAAVIETSPGSFQAWLRHTQPLSREVGTLAAKTLASQFRADTSAADWRRFGRAPGFTNRKPQHRNANGFFPYARLICHPGQPFAKANAFHSQLLNLQHQKDEECATHRRVRDPRSLHFVSPVTLSRFRMSIRYQGRPAAADLAFSIAACTQGWTVADIAAALSHDYLSRDTNPSRRAAYIRRTVTKALDWAA